jgi:LuxR family maltose regulon positive regulatory protein
VAILYTSDRRAKATMDLLQAPLEMAEGHWRAEGNLSRLGQVLSFKTMVAWFQENSPKSLAGARQSLEMLPVEDVFWRSLNLIGAGLEELLAGRLNAAQQTMLEARATSKAAGNFYGMLSATYFLGEVYARQGKLGQAARHYQQVLAGIPEEADDIILRLTDFDRGRALIGLGALSLEWNDLESAEQQLTQALDIGQQLPDEELQVRSSLLIAKLLHTRGETRQAQELLQTIIAQTSPKWWLLLREARLSLTGLSLSAGDTGAAEHWYTTWVQSGEEAPAAQQEQEQLVVARLRIAQGQAEAALPLLESRQAEAHSQGRKRSELEIMILTALAHFAQHDLTQARQALIIALEMARPEGFQRIFLDEKEPMAALLQDTLLEIREESLAAYARALRYTMAQEQTQHTHTRQTRQEPELIIEPLSEREQRVLSLLAAGLTTQEIAGELIISINTVKTHVKNIYGKLGVNSRQQARQAARHLNLLK